MTTRILTGFLKRRVIGLPHARVTRPTREMVRKAIFDVLGDAVAGVDVLDVFSGSGALGLEAISAGARHVTFVEKNRDCCAVIRRNVAALGQAPCCRIISRDVFSALAYLARKQRRFGLIIADPPYAKDLAKKCLLALGNYDIVNAPAIVVIEHRKSDTLPQQSNSLTLWQCKKYGDTFVSFYISDK